MLLCLSCYYGNRHGHNEMYIMYHLTDCTTSMSNVITMLGKKKKSKYYYGIVIVIVSMVTTLS